MINNTLYNNKEVSVNLSLLFLNSNANTENAQGCYLKTLPCLFLECRANFYLQLIMYVSS